MIDLLLSKCIEKYRSMLDACGQVEDCPTLPKSLVVYFVKGSKHRNVYKTKQRLQAWRYSGGELFSLPTDAQPVQVSQQEYFTCEPYAEFGICRFTRKAFINFYAGNGSSMGFEYEAEFRGRTCMLGIEKVLWKE